MIRYLLVVIGGGTGALARYVAAAAIMTRFGGKFPLGTLVINVTGSFLIGFLMTMLTERFKLDPNWRLLLVVGFSFAWRHSAPLRHATGSTAAHAARPPASAAASQRRPAENGRAKRTLHPGFNN